MLQWRPQAIGREARSYPRGRIGARLSAQRDCALADRPAHRPGGAPDHRIPRLPQQRSAAAGDAAAGRGRQESAGHPRRRQRHDRRLVAASAGLSGRRHRRHGRQCLQGGGRCADRSERAALPARARAGRRHVIGDLLRQCRGRRHRRALSPPCRPQAARLCRQESPHPRGSLAPFRLRPGAPLSRARSARHCRGREHLRGRPPCRLGPLLRSRAAGRVVLLQRHRGLRSAASRARVQASGAGRRRHHRLRQPADGRLARIRPDHHRLRSACSCAAGDRASSRFVDRGRHEPGNFLVRPELVIRGTTP